jgi:hypothetical protein
MILLDTNVIIYALDDSSPYCKWAKEVIAGAVLGEGAGINVVSLAEICVGAADPSTVSDEIRSWGVAILDLPAATAEPCAKAYLRYRKRRASQSNKPLSATPLPEFFIGAHAHIMGWEIATADRDRFAKYFPSVSLKTPQ